jgi:NAD(P)-dependent dehydrogenase (short-subunit alcohol dehydrogenase family)
LIGLGKALASELGGLGIRINTICPGLVRTKLAEMLWKSDAGKMIQDGLFLQRLADPEDIAGSIAFFLSEDARHITGETLIVAGGISSRL